jgi:FKBP-type peptidyl-prolyl cis-trans isomerase
MSRRDQFTDHVNHYKMEKKMLTKVIWSNVAIMVVFTATGLTMFTENVRTVQVLGLFASGAVFGASMARIIAAYRAREKQA